MKSMTWQKKWSFLEERQRNAVLQQKIKEQEDKIEREFLVSFCGLFKDRNDT